MRVLMCIVAAMAAVMESKEAAESHISMDSDSNLHVGYPDQLVYFGAHEVSERMAALAPARDHVAMLTRATWAEVNHDYKITTEDAAEGAMLGTSVAISGNTLLVGASFKESANNRNGAVFIFNRTKLGGNGYIGRYTQVGKLQHDDNMEYFGRAVALDDTVAIVGSTGAANISGVVRVFKRLENLMFEPVSPIRPRIEHQELNFGCAVALHQNTLVVGASGDTEADALAGVIYVYQKHGNFSFNEDHTLIISDPKQANSFGHALALQNDLLVVGASKLDSGLVFLFEKNSLGRFELTSSIDAMQRLHFGFSLALEDDTLVIGSGSGGREPLAGSVHVYERNVFGVFEKVFQLKASDGSRDDRFGYSVALCNGTLAVGTDSVGKNAGALYVYEFIP